MKPVFLIFGYGVPKDIFQDENYNFYLKMAFNRIYDLCQEAGVRDPLIICSGGKTDFFEPYERSEGEEMQRFLRHLAERPFLKEQTEDWSLLAETESLSTLENYLHSKSKLEQERASFDHVYVFCEQTRKERIQAVGQAVFPKQELTVCPIDFDVSAQRYLDSTFLAEKERVELNHSLWALESPEHLEKHHEIFQEKMDQLRAAKPEDRGDVLKKWWEEKLVLYQKEDL